MQLRLSTGERGVFWPRQTFDRVRLAHDCQAMSSSEAKQSPQGRQRTGVLESLRGQLYIPRPCPAADGLDANVSTDEGNQREHRTHAALVRSFFGGCAPVHAKRPGAPLRSIFDIHL